MRQGEIVVFVALVVVTMLVGIGAVLVMQMVGGAVAK